MTGRASRSKGHRGELQVAHLIRDLTGWDVRRRVRQHDGDSDLEGVPGWAVEVKNCAAPTLGDIDRWTVQAKAQAKESQRWVLFYKRQPGQWRAVFCLADVEVETSVQDWCQCAREALA